MPEGRSVMIRRRHGQPRLADIAGPVYDGHGQLREQEMKQAA